MFAPAFQLQYRMEACGVAAQRVDFEKAAVLLNFTKLAPLYAGEDDSLEKVFDILELSLKCCMDNVSDAKKKTQAARKSIEFKMKATGDCLSTLRQTESLPPCCFMPIGLILKIVIRNDIHDAELDNSIAAVLQGSSDRLVGTFSHHLVGEAIMAHVVQYNIKLKQFTAKNAEYTRKLTTFTPLNAFGDTKQSQIVVLI